MSHYASVSKIAGKDKTGRRVAYRQYFESGTLQFSRILWLRPCHTAEPVIPISDSQFARGNCGNILAILSSWNRERASAIQFSSEDNHFEQISMSSNSVARKISWRGSMAALRMN